MGYLQVLYFSIVFHLRMYRVDGVEEWKESPRGRGYMYAYAYDSSKGFFPTVVDIMVI